MLFIMRRLTCVHSTVQRGVCFFTNPLTKKSTPTKHFRLGRKFFVVAESTNNDNSRDHDTISDKVLRVLSS